MAAALVSPAAALAERSDWREMTVGNFELFSTLSDSGTRNVARQLLGFQETLGEMLKTGERLPDTPTRIYLLSDRDFNQYAAPRSGLGGFFVEGHVGNIMVVNADKDFELVRVTLFHEFIHYIQRNTSTQKYPPWYTEGYAELFSGYKLDGVNLSVGYQPVGTMVNLAQWIPVERLLAVKQTDPEYRTERLAPQFYGESWVLVHFLLFDDKALSGPALRYLGNMNLGFPEPEAFATAFPFDKAALDAQLRKFVAGGRIHVKRFILRDPVIVDQAPLMRLTPAQADAEFTRLIWKLSKPKAVVDGLVAKLEAGRRDDPSVQALIARIAAHEGEPTSIDDLAATLAKGGVNDLQERLDVADALLYKKSGDPANRQALAILGDVVKSEVPPVEAVELWTNAATRTGVGPEKIIAVLESLLVRVPHDTAVLRSLAWAYESTGDKAKARDAYDQIILVSASPEERHWAQQQADSARLQDAPPQASP
ncbi:MAG: hypothetical protein ACHQIL_00705 [Steroidobacterales bacterium]